jgi:hypothetical protein
MVWTSPASRQRRPAQARAAGGQHAQRQGDQQAQGQGGRRQVTCQARRSGSRTAGAIHRRSPASASGLAARRLHQGLDAGRGGRPAGRGRVVGDHLAAGHHHDPVGQQHGLGDVVGDHHRGQAQLPRAGGGRRRPGPRGSPGPARRTARPSAGSTAGRQGPGHADPLALAAGQGGGRRAATSRGRATRSSRSRSARRSGRRPSPAGSG